MGKFFLSKRFFWGALLLFFLSSFGMWQIENPEIQKRERILEIQPNEHFAYVGRTGRRELSSHNGFSNAFVLEDGKSFQGKGNCAHDDIRKMGGGRFSFWHDVVYFSASDNTDPRENKRVYEIVFLEKEGIPIYLEFIFCISICWIIGASIVFLIQADFFPNRFIFPMVLIASVFIFILLGHAGYEKCIKSLFDERAQGYFDIVFVGIYCFFFYSVFQILIIFIAKSFFQNRERWQKLFLIFSNIIILLVGVEIVSYVLIQRILKKEGEGVRKLYSYCFNNEKLYMQGETVHFQEHHYLNYILNPEIEYSGQKQINNDFKIRRSEEIRPKKELKRRILVLGGSTTFGEKIPKEEDTWVFLLEKYIRNKFGPNFDVINGGVGGYTIAENFIHYITLLTHLEPDIILLYVGINDVHPRLFDQIQFDYSNYRIPWRSSGAILPRANSTLSIFSFYRYYFLQREIVNLKHTGIGGVVSKPYPNPSDWEMRLSQNGPEIYRGYLENLVSLCQGQGRKVVILPQHFTIAGENDKVFKIGVDQHNHINYMLAEKFKCPFGRIISLPTTFSQDDTFDSCHFNEKGSKKMAEAIFCFLDENKILEVSSQ